MSFDFAARLKSVFVRLFADREFMHYSSEYGMRVFRVTRRMQLTAAGAALCLVAYALTMTGVALTAGSAADTAQVEVEAQGLRRELALLRNDVAMKAASLEAKQVFIEEVIAGEADIEDLQRSMPMTREDEISSTGLLAPFSAVEQRQQRLLEVAAATAAERLEAQHRRLEELGLSPNRYGAENGMGGPDMPIVGGEDEASPRFATLLNNWGRLDQLQEALETVPHVWPAADYRFTSEFGQRVDPFRRRASMHSGIDLAAPRGTEILSSAPGRVIRAGWAGSYGNMIEIDHGKGLTTRYAHLSRIHVSSGDRVGAGELIGKMGSTGRSTGSHLHFEVRIDGRAVDPLPYLEGMHVAMNAETGAQGGGDR